MKHEKISRVIIQPVRNLQLRLHCKLVKENQGRKENFHNEFKYGKSSYVKLDLQSFMTLEIIGDFGDWDASKSLLIDQRNIYQITKGFEEMRDNLYKKDLFFMDKKKNIKIHSDLIDDNTVRIFNSQSNQRILLRPAVIMDDQDITYEGVIIYINKTENYVELPLDAFESLVYALEKVDMYLYSQLLLNYYVTMCKEKEKEDKPKAVVKSNVFESKPEPKTESNFVKEVKDEEFFNFENK